MKDSTSTPKTTGATPSTWSAWNSFSFRRSLWPAYRQLLLHSQAPILCGPFHGEVGFEVLYWVPFVAKLIADGIAPARLIPISRGGAAVWYGVPHGLELYAMRTLADVRIAMRAHQIRTGMHKQFSLTPWDRAVLRDAADTLHIGRRHWVLHPSWMYHACTPFWQDRMGLGPLEQLLRFGPMPVPPLPDGLTLPEGFIAVKFYSRSSFQATPLLHSFTEHTIRQIAARSPVVLLDITPHVDDHLDCPVPAIPNVTRLSSLVPQGLPETNLATQSAVIARAMGFVGTYGGLAHLALRFQRPVVCFYAEWEGILAAHRTLSERLALAMRTQFSLLRVMEIPILQAVLPHVEVTPAPTGSQTPFTGAAV